MALSGPLQAASLVLLALTLGIALVRALRRPAAPRWTWPRSSAMRWAERMGAAGHLSKPFEVRELLDVTRKFVA